MRAAVNTVRLLPGPLFVFVALFMSLLGALVAVSVHAGVSLAQAEVRSLPQDSIATELFLPLILHDALPVIIATSTPPPASPTTLATPEIEPTARPGPVRPTEPPDPLPPDDVYASCLVHEEEDRTGDGVPEREVDTFYDNLSRPALRNSDLDGDGDADQLESWEYGDQGLVRYFRQKGADLLYKTFSYTDGHLVSEVWRESEDGEPVTIFTLEYNAEGLLVRDLAQARIEGALYVTQQREYGYDEVGRRVWKTVNRARFTYFWDDDTIIRLDVDRDGDGNVDWITRLWYDDSRRVLRRELDLSNLDAIAEDVYLYAYESHGWVTDREWWRGGHLESSARWAYNERGQVLNSMFGSGIGGIARHYDYDCK